MLDPARWTQISLPFDELLTLPPADRPARLDALQRSDPALAQDLRQLLQAHDEVARDGFLGTPLETGWTAGDTGPDAGDALRAWTLVDVVGEGGMGRVWRARRNDGRFEGDAAIKLAGVPLDVRGRVCHQVARQPRWHRSWRLTVSGRHRPGMPRLVARLMPKSMRRRPGIRSTTQGRSDQNLCAGIGGDGPQEASRLGRAIRVPARIEDDPPPPQARLDNVSQA